MLIGSPDPNTLVQAKFAGSASPENKTGFPLAFQGYQIKWFSNILKYTIYMSSLKTAKIAMALIDVCFLQRLSCTFSQQRP